MMCEAHPGAPQPRGSWQAPGTGTEVYFPKSVAHPVRFQEEHTSKSCCVPPEDKLKH